ncbi:MAG: hypothetical protein JW910_20910 [Anaerolineae bacterium]|nr:hypothetical protein [Anaerolineae bacterium]
MQHTPSNPPSDPTQHADEPFPSFPAPRVWGLGWAGNAWAAPESYESTADFMSTPPQPSAPPANKQPPTR